MKYLVTGCTGLLGKEILDVSQDSIGISTSDCDLINEDMTPHIKDGVTTVIHCAARVGGIKANTEKVADFFDDNIKMNMNVVETCKSKNLKLVSVLSTCVYPDANYVTYPLTEEQLHCGPPHASNFGYAYAKRMLEVQSRAYKQQYGCSFISVIPNNLYGTNDNYDLNSGHVIPALIRKFFVAKMHGHDSVEIWGSGKPLREFTFAKDAAKIILWLAQNYEDEIPINIGNPEQVSISELAHIISQEMEYDGKIVFNDAMPDGQYQKPSSNQRLVSLGWNENYVSLKDGISQTVKHFCKVYPNLRGITMTK